MDFPVARVCVFTTYTLLFVRSLCFFDRFVSLVLGNA